MILFHVLPTAAWSASPDPYAPPSLAAEGFIHLSTREQVAPTLARWFAGARDLTLLVLDVDEGLQWADVVHDDGSTGRFPHLHRPLRRDEVVEALVAEDGPALAEALAAWG